MMKYTDFFDLADNGGNKPIAAMLMTYGFDAGLFEHHILPAFLGIIDDPNENELRFRNQIALRLKEVPILVISDANQFNGGRTFLYDHIVVDTETFHPKCYLLLYKEFLRVIISSANITKSGLCYNAELVWHYDIYLDKESTLSNDINEILSFLQTKYNIHDVQAINEIIKYLKQVNSIEGFPKVISTCAKEYVFTRIIEEIRKCSGICKSITIMSPFFENDREKAMEGSLLVSFFNELIEIYHDIKIKICFPASFNDLENKYMVNAPVGIFQELDNKFKNINFFVVPKEWEREDEEAVPRTLHGKLIMAEFDNRYNLYLTGSVNFTNNAMRSKISKLNNIEIGVLNYTKSKLFIPDCSKVSVSKLKVIEKDIDENKKPYFVESAVFDGVDLTIKFKEEQMILPCEIKYSDHVIFKAIKKQDELIINNFSLEKSQDIEIACNEYSFFVPILIPNKDEIITEDLKLKFEFDMKDIIDYLAGRYRSLIELERIKKLISQMKSDSNLSINIYFRQNLQRFYKALASLKNGLEQPYYSECSFINYINNPIGIKNLLSMIIRDYKNNASSEGETFLFLVEILHIVKHLEFEEDWLKSEYKQKVLIDLTVEAEKIVKSIVKDSKGQLKKQYQLMIKSYGLEG
ncbi:hypothetical protein [Clostridium sp. YIM B02569]|uniref:hypothetical protein n=1 Tax=Clostridium sp. YIM B02569 TaxID=2911967 RepID=UPI001EE9F772|nr:hypothetical protein [Clostridium sp. YIM B02569]